MSLLPFFNYLVLGFMRPRSTRITISLLKFVFAQSPLAPKRLVREKYLFAQKLSR